MAGGFFVIERCLSRVLHAHCRETKKGGSTSPPFFANHKRKTSTMGNKAPLSMSSCTFHYITLSVVKPAFPLIVAVMVAVPAPMPFPRPLRFFALVTFAT